VTVLAAEFPQAQHLRNLGMGSASDTQIWQYARANAYMIVTKDSDLHQWSLLLGQPPKVIWLRVGNCPTETVVRLLRSRSEEIREFHDDPAAAFLVLV
jgi:predicted nuclease of predicted toxin-antitoxin system